MSAPVLWHTVCHHSSINSISRCTSIPDSSSLMSILYVVTCFKNNYSQVSSIAEHSLTEDYLFCHQMFIFVVCSMSLFSCQVNYRPQLWYKSFVSYEIFDFCSMLNVFTSKWDHLTKKLFLKDIHSRCHCYLIKYCTHSLWRQRFSSTNS